MPFIKVTALTPQHIPTSKDYWQAIEKAVRKTNGLILRDLQATTRTWQHKPAFDITTTMTGDSYNTVAGTDSDIYKWVSEGTKPHTIRAKRSPYLIFQGGYKPKTKVGIINSYDGGRDANGEWFRKKQVQHPGFPGRQFIAKIAARRQVTMEQEVSQAIAQVNRLQK